MIKFISNRPIFLSLFLILSCEKNENPMASINTVDSPILFAQCYVNHAWGYQYSGWYVDKTGWIYEVDKNATIKLDDVSQDTIFTERLMIDLLHSSS